MLSRWCVLQRCGGVSRQCAATTTRAAAAAAVAMTPTALRNVWRTCSSTGSSSTTTTTTRAGDAATGEATPAQATTTTTATTPTTATAAATPGVAKQASINSVTLVGVVHDVQTGYVYEDAVTQFTLTTTSLDTTSPTQECVIEKDHHTIRCYGDVFAQQMKATIKEGSVVCVNGRLRLNPQLEASCGKYYYYPYIHVQPPHGQVAVVYGDHRTPPTLANGNHSGGGGSSNADANNTTTTTSNGGSGGDATERPAS